MRPGLVWAILVVCCDVKGYAQTSCNQMPITTDEFIKSSNRAFNSPRLTAFRGLPLGPHFLLHCHSFRRFAQTHLGCLSCRRARIFCFSIILAISER